MSLILFGCLFLGGGFFYVTESLQVAEVSASHQELLMELRILKVEKGTWADAAGFMASSVARKTRKPEIIEA